MSSSTSMLRCPRLLLLLFIGFSPLTYVRPVRAEPTSSDQERARRHYDAARSYYDVGKYEDAAREFRSAYELSGRPHLLKNVATALERAGSFAESAQALEEYLRLQPDAEDRRSVEIHIKQLQERAKKQESSAEAQTQGGTSQKANKPPAEPVNPPAAQGAASAEPDKHEKSQLPAWLLIGAGGALGAGALVTGLMSHSKFQDLESKCTNNVCPSDLRSERDQGKTLAVVSTVLTVAAVASAGVGVTLLFVSGGEGKPEARVGAIFQPDRLMLATDIKF